MTSCTAKQKTDSHFTRLLLNTKQDKYEYNIVNMIFNFLSSSLLTDYTQRLMDYTLRMKIAKTSADWRVFQFPTALFGIYAKYGYCKPIS